MCLNEENKVDAAVWKQHPELQEKSKWYKSWDYRGSAPTPIVCLLLGLLINGHNAECWICDVIIVHTNQSKVGYEK